MQVHAGASASQMLKHCIGGCFVFDGYSCLCSSGGAWGPEEADAVERVAEYIASTESSASVCLICLETMGAADTVWHCSESCHCVVHLLCIQVTFKLEKHQKTVQFVQSVTTLVGPPA